MRARSALPIAAVLGLVCAAAFEPWSVPFAMVIGVAGFFALLRAMRDSSRRLVALTGFVFGLAFMGVLIWWMNAVSGAAYGVLVFIEALFFAAIAVVVRTAARARFWPVWVASVWTAGELFRGAFPLSGFPWGRLAHTALDTPFESYARAFALPATTAILAVCSALLVLAVERRNPRALAPIVAFAVIGMLLPVGLAGDDGTRRVAVVQGNTPGSFLQWPRGEIFQMHIAETETIDEPVDLVLWPENGSDLDVFTNAYAQSELKRVSARVGAPILVGAILDGPTDDTAYNASVVVDENGPHDEIYLKQNIVPYGEYVPFRRQLGPIVPRFDRDIPRDMISGDSAGALRVGDTLVGTTICWDVAYDTAIHGAVDLGAQILTVQTSNASFMDFGQGIQPQQQWAISRLRAIETGRYVLVPSTNGISGVIAPDGSVVARAPVKTGAVLVETVHLASGRTGATRWGGPISVLICVAAVAGWIFGIRAGRGRHA